MPAAAGATRVAAKRLICFAVCMAMVLCSMWLGETQKGIQTRGRLGLGDASGRWRRSGENDSTKSCKDVIKETSLSFEEKCELVKRTCAEEDSLIDYVGLVYCSKAFASSAGVARIFVYTVFFLLQLSLLASTTEFFFCPALEVLSEELKLSPTVAGTTLLAFGNSAPDVFTQFAAFNTHGDAGLQLGALMGGSTFCLSAVLGLCIVVANRLPRYPRVSEGSFYRDSISYTVGLIIIVSLASSGTVTAVNAALLLFYYMIYIAAVVVTNWLRPPRQKFRSVGRRKKTGWKAWMRSVTSRFSFGRSSDVELVALEDDWPCDDSEENFLETEVSNDSGDEYTNSRLLWEEKDEEIDRERNNDQGNLLEIDMDDISWSENIDQGMTAAGRGVGEDDLLLDHYNDDSSSDTSLIMGVKSKPKVPIGWFHWPQEEGHLVKVRYVGEMPFTVLRWLTIPPCDGHWDQLRRILGCFSVPGLLLLTVGQFGGWYRLGQNQSGSSFALWIWLVAAGAVCSLVLYCTTASAKENPAQVVFALLAFVGCVEWISLLGNEIVALLTACSMTLDVSTSILGVTLLAVGNSIGDLVSCATVTRNGNLAMALGSLFGSPLFHDVAGLGASFFYGAMQTEAKEVHFRVHTQTFIAWIFLFITLGAVIGSFALSTFRPSAGVGFALMGLYAMFLSVCLLQEAGYFGAQTQ